MLLQDLQGMLGIGVTVIFVLWFALAGAAPLRWTGRLREHGRHTHPLRVVGSRWAVKPRWIERSAARLVSWRATHRAKERAIHLHDTAPPCPRTAQRAVPTSLRPGAREGRGYS